jgi:beta-lactamase superfamily II metal-dependent hydrolase
MRWSSGDGVTLDLLAPSLPFLADTGDDVNENSIVAMLHYQGFRELFMGNAGEASEERLLQAVDDLHANVPMLSRSVITVAPTPRLRPSPRTYGRRLP